MGAVSYPIRTIMPFFFFFAIIIKRWERFGYFFFMSCQHKSQQCGDNIFGWLLCHTSRNPPGCLTERCLLPIVSLKAQCAITFVVSPLCCSGITSTWTPSRFPQVLWDNASNERVGGGFTLTLMWRFSVRRKVAGVAWIFYKSSFNELARLCLSSHFAGGLITSRRLINGDVAAGERRVRGELSCLGWRWGRSPR